MLPISRNQNIHMIFVGVALITLSLFLPLIVNVKTFQIVHLIFRSLETVNVGPLIDASIRLVLMNTIRIVPVYLGALIIADMLNRERVSSKYQEHWLLCRLGSVGKWIAPVLLAPFLYRVIEAIYGIRYDFRMPALLSIATVIVALRMSRIDPLRSLPRTALIVTQLVFAFQWLDIVPALTGLGFGHGEISSTLKITVEVLNAESLFNLFGLVAAGVLLTSGLISAKFMVDYEQLLSLARLEKEHSLHIERMRSEAVLARSYRETQALVHDLKTPLTTIQGLASAMAEFSADTGMSAHAQRISSSADRMDTMIQEMMRGSARSNVTVEDFLNKLSAYLPEEKTHGLVTFQATTGLPMISINQIRLIRAVVNLIDNAIDANATEIAIYFGEDNGELVIVVEDNGMGMTEEGLASWWEGGYSTKNSTGLGLRFVKEVAEEHQGCLHIERALTRGTKCVLRIPVLLEVETDGQDSSR